MEFEWKMYLIAKKNFQVIAIHKKTQCHENKKKQINGTPLFGLRTFK
jgi:hypothetical protein